MSLHPKFTLWRDRLESLLADAIDAIESDDQSRQKCAQQLHDFIRENPASVPSDPSSGVFEEMDTIARSVRDALFLESVSGRVAAIMSRAYELGELEKKVRVQAAFNEQEARTLRLEKSRQVVATTTATIEALKALKLQLDEGAESDQTFTAMSRRIAKVVDALQDLRAQVEETS